MATSDRFGTFLQGVTLPTARALEELRRRISPGIQPWTPTITQGSAVAGTVNRGWYVKRSDGTFQATLHWAATAAGTAANSISVSLPLSVASVYDLGGSVVFYDSGTPLITTGVPWPGGALATFGIYVTGSNANLLGVSPAITLASGDIIVVTVHGRWQE